MIFRTYRVQAAVLRLLATALASWGATAGEVQDRVQARGEVRVCIWPAYQRISFRDPRSGQLSGLDIDLATALASDLRVKLPQRMEQLQFPTPYLQSDIYAVTTRTSRIVRQWSDIDQPGVQVGVQAGTFMEPVMRQRLKHAGLVSIHLPQTRERELIAGRVDVFMTDYPYGRALIESTEWAALVAPPKPFYTLPYAHASKPGDVEWRAVLNAFVARIRQDGSTDSKASS